jgi:hypothetical protein
VNAEWLTAAASVATLLVVAVTAYAALRQIKHLRSGNQVAALLPLAEEYQAPNIQNSMNYVLGSLRSDLNDPVVRAGVTAVPAEGLARQALPCFNFYESVGALVGAGALDLELVLRYFLLPSDLWEIGLDYIALSRRSRGPEVFENLEALVAMEREYAKRHGTSRYPAGLPHLDVPDRWAPEDGA